MVSGIGDPSPSGRYIARVFQPGDESGINEGFNRVFGQNRTLGEWRWKFPKAPAGRWISVVVDSSGAVLAHFAAVPMPMQSPNGPFLAGQGADAYCVPEFREQGLYGRAVSCFFEVFSGEGGIGFFLGFAGPRNAEVLVRRHGFQDLGQAPLWQRNCRPRRRWLPFAHELREGFDQVAAELLWRRVSGRYPWAGIRDGSWMSRRFSGRPGVEYRHLSAWRKGVPKAWVVLRCRGDRVQIGDWLWDGEDERAVLLLDHQVARESLRAGAAFEEQWLAGDRGLARVLEERNWAPASLEAPNHLVVRRCMERVPTPSEVGDFYITFGDADLV